MKITYDRRHKAGMTTDQIPQEIGAQGMPHSQGKYTPFPDGGHAVLLQTIACKKEPVQIWDLRIRCPAASEIYSRITLEEDRMLLVLLLKGKARARVHPFNTISVEAPRYFPILAPKGQPYPVVFEGEEVHIFLCAISGEVLDDLIKESASFAYFKECAERQGHQALALHDVLLPSAIAKIILQFLDPGAPPALNWKTHCKNMICQMLQGYLNDISKDDKRIKAQIEEILLFSTITYYISGKPSEKPPEDLSLDHLCGKYFCTPKQLQTLFKKRAGTTVLVFVRVDRLAKAEYLLTNEPHWTMDKIYKACGYKTYSAFWYAFNQMRHMTPSEFRAAYSNLT